MDEMKVSSLIWSETKVQPFLPHRSDMSRLSSEDNEGIEMYSVWSVKNI